MPLNLIKLCVGIDSVETLEAWARVRSNGGSRPTEHVTRRLPRRASEILDDGGSLYWVIGGAIQARQEIRDLQTFLDDEGVDRCRIVLDPTIVATRPVPRRAFQGWRYLEADGAPADLNGFDGEDLPPELHRSLAELGLL